MPAVRLHFVLVQTMSLVKFKLSIIITVEILYASYTYDNCITRMMGPYLLSYGMERFICSRSDDVGDDVPFSVRLSVVSHAVTACLFSRLLSYNLYIDDVIVGFSHYGSHRRNFQGVRGYTYPPLFGVGGTVPPTFQANGRKITVIVPEHTLKIHCSSGLVRSFTSSKTLALYSFLIFIVFNCIVP